MAFTHGMNVEQGSTIGRQLKDRSADVSNLMNRVDALVNEAANNWHGQDANNFRNEWATNYRRAMQQLATELAQLGQKAVANAEEQRQVSGR